MGSCMHIWIYGRKYHTTSALHICDNNNNINNERRKRNSKSREKKINNNNRSTYIRRKTPEKFSPNANVERQKQREKKEIIALEISAVVQPATFISLFAFARCEMQKTYHKNHPNIWLILHSVHPHHSPPYTHSHWIESCEFSSNGGWRVVSRMAEWATISKAGKKTFFLHNFYIHLN